MSATVDGSDLLCTGRASYGRERSHGVSGQANCRRCRRWLRDRRTARRTTRRPRDDDPRRRARGGRLEVDRLARAERLAARRAPTTRARARDRLATRLPRERGGARAANDAELARRPAPAGDRQRRLQPRRRGDRGGPAARGRRARDRQLGLGRRGRAARARVAARPPGRRARALARQRPRPPSRRAARLDHPADRADRPRDRRDRARRGAHRPAKRRPRGGRAPRASSATARSGSRRSASTSCPGREVRSEFEATAARARARGRRRRSSSPTTGSIAAPAGRSPSARSRPARPRSSAASRTSVTAGVLEYLDQQGISIPERRLDHRLRRERARLGQEAPADRHLPADRRPRPLREPDGHLEARRSRPRSPASRSCARACGCATRPPPPAVLVGAPRVSAARREAAPPGSSPTRSGRSPASTARFPCRDRCSSGRRPSRAAPTPSSGSARRAAWRARPTRSGAACPSRRSSSSALAPLLLGADAARPELLRAQLVGRLLALRRARALPGRRERGRPRALGPARQARRRSARRPPRQAPQRRSRSAASAATSARATTGSTASRRRWRASSRLGCKAVKVTIGADEPAVDVRRLAAVREVVGPDCVLVADAFRSFTSLDDALRRLAPAASRSTSPTSRIPFSESLAPLVADLRRRTGLLIGLGENLAGHRAFRELLAVRLRSTSCAATRPSSAASASSWRRRRSPRRTASSSRPTSTRTSTSSSARRSTCTRPASSTCRPTRASTGSSSCSHARSRSCDGCALAPRPSRARARLGLGRGREVRAMASWRGAPPHDQRARGRRRRRGAVLLPVGRAARAAVPDRLPQHVDPDRGLAHRSGRDRAAAPAAARAARRHGARAHLPHARHRLRRPGARVQRHVRRALQRRAARPSRAATRWGSTSTPTSASRTAARCTDSRRSSRRCRLETRGDLIVGEVERNGITILTATLPYKQRAVDPAELRAALRLQPRTSTTS